MSRSKQLNFFILPEDWQTIHDFFIEMGVTILKGTITTNESIYTGETAIKGEDLYQVYLVMDEYEKSIYFKRDGKVDFIDVLKSNVIEFDRGGFYPYSTKILHRARLYSVTKFYDGDINISKDGNFIKWIEHIYRLFKKRFLKQTEINKDFLFSEGAIKWVHENKARMDAAGLEITSSI